MRNSALAFWLVLLSAATVSFAQTTDANLIGTIVDATGALVPGATVQATSEATGVQSGTTADSNGQYRFNNMMIGRYDVSASAPNFASAVVKGVQLQLNRTVTTNITLSVATVSTAVDVTEAGASVDTTTAQIQSTFEDRQIRDLPIIESANGLYGALNLSLLSAGVASNGGVGQGTGPSVGGQRPTENNFTVEGVDNNNKGITGPLVYVPTESTAEFTLLENQYGAEFGHSTGGQFNTLVKSGTNEIHGALYEYFQNRNLNALDQQFARQGFTSPTRYDQNRLGGNVGGPLIRDKLFWFGSLEYAPLGEAYTPGAPVYAPTAAGYALLNGMSGISKTNLSFLQQFVPAAPVANGQPTVVNGVSIPTGILPIAGAFYNNFWTVVGSVNYNPSQKDQIRGRFIYNRSNAQDNNAALPEFWTILPQRWYIATISDYHTFAPSITNELRLGYNRFTQYYTVGNQTFPGLDVIPNIQFDNDLGLQIGPDPNAPQFTVQNTYQLVENLNWTRGKHTFRFGFDGRNYIAPQFFIQRVRGDYNYTTLGVFLNDQIPDDLAERNLGNTPYYGNQWATYLYATDQWRLRSNLTLDLGVRWERTTVAETMLLQNLNSLASVPGLISFNSPTTANKNFAPRIGIAYSPGSSGNTSIRAGFGMGYDVIYDNVGLTAYPPQLSPTIDACISPGNCPGYSAPFLANGGIRPTDLQVGSQLTPEEARAATSSYIPDQVVPYSIQWNVGVQHVFHGNYTAEVRYLGTRGVHLLMQDQINKTNTPVTAARGLPTFLSAPSQAQLDSLSLTLPQLQAISPIDPRFAANGFTSNITAFMPVGNSLYHGLAAQLNRRFSNGLQFVGAYTFSHNIDDSTASHFSTYLTPRRPMDFGNLQIDRGNSALDRRHRFTGSWLWEVPWYSHSQNWAMKNLVGNWRFVGVYTYETGEFMTAQSGLDSNLNGDTAGDRTIINPDGAANVGSDVTALRNSSGAIVGYLANNPNARYIRAGLGAFPNGGRNTLEAPSINNFDFSLGKRFNFSESKAFEIRCDATNVFNHAQFTPGYVNSVRLNQSYTLDRSYLEPQNNNFQAWSSIFSSNSRTLQLAAHIFF